MSTCSEHNQKPLVYYCLDGKCTKAPLNCIICVKNNHAKCNDSLIM